tara:strand:+ start:504 stop:1226 length:723 start_codon:yes stop_codon:yes gene_type:complete
MNILIPIAGLGSRFSVQGVDTPKPIIDIKNKTMIERAVESLNMDGRLIFITRKYSNNDYNILLKNTLGKIDPSSVCLQIDFLTEGPASSCLLAEKYIDNNDELLITNCDQIMTWDVKKFKNVLKKTSNDGIVVTYEASTEKNSYVKLNKDNLATEFAEKKVISNFSLNGIHWWKRGSDFVESAKSMISKNIRVNNEFYISNTYNQLLDQGKKIGVYHIDSREHWPVGTPKDLKRYLDENF